MIITRKREAQEKICLCCNSRKAKKEKHRKTGEKRKRKSIEKLISQYEHFKGHRINFILYWYKLTFEIIKSKFDGITAKYKEIELIHHSTMGKNRKELLNSSNYDQKIVRQLRK